MNDDAREVRKEDREKERDGVCAYGYVSEWVSKGAVDTRE
jgi:hypothetical protein